jgi:hypothetical protein
LQHLIPWTRSYAWKFVGIDQDDVAYLQERNNLDFEPIKARNFNIQLEMASLSITKLPPNLIASMGNIPLDNILFKIRIKGHVEDAKIQQFANLLNAVPFAVQKITVGLIAFPSECKFREKEIYSVTMKILAAVQRKLKLLSKTKFSVSVFYHYGDANSGNFLNITPPAEAASSQPIEAAQSDEPLVAQIDANSFNAANCVFEDEFHPASHVPVTKLILAHNPNYSSFFSLKQFDVLKRLSIKKFVLTEPLMEKSLEWLQEASSSYLVIDCDILSYSTPGLLRKFVAGLISISKIACFEIAASETRNGEFMELFSKEIEEMEIEISPTHLSGKQMLISFERQD